MDGRHRGSQDPRDRTRRIGRLIRPTEDRVRIAPLSVRDAHDRHAVRSVRDVPARTLT